MQEYRMASYIGGFIPQERADILKKEIKQLEGTMVSQAKEIGELKFYLETLRTECEIVVDFLEAGNQPSLETISKTLKRAVERSKKKEEDKNGL